jgi:hypothetical protein
MAAYLVEVDSARGGREAQQRRAALCPSSQPTCPLTQPRTCSMRPVAAFSTILAAVCGNEDDFKSRRFCKKIQTI